MNTNNDPIALGKYLVDLDQSLAGAVDGDERWVEVASAARALADALRTRGQADIHGQLGSSSLPKALSSIIRGSPGATGVPSRALRVDALYEVLRVGANLSMDHDENRAALMQTEYVDNVVALLESYLPFVHLPSEKDEQSKNVEPLSVGDLKVIKTAIGALLNVSADYEPAREKLLCLEVPLIVLRIICGAYSAASWTLSSSSNTKEEWELRLGISNWGWRALDDWKEPSDAEGESKASVLAASSLPYLISPLSAFIPPFPTELPSMFSDAPSRQALIEADMEVLEQVCMFLETLSLDVPDVRVVLGRSSVIGLSSEAAYLPRIVRFVEELRPPTYWSEHPEKDQKRWNKMLVLCKAAAVKSIIAVSGEDKNLDVLWQGKEEGQAGWFLKTMLRWIKAYQPRSKSKEEDGYDDMAICATLALGNLARNDEHCTSLVQSDLSVVPNLVLLLDKKIDIKLKHGVTGLLKNLAQAPNNRTALGDAGVLEALAGSTIWDGKWDIAETVQLSAIGVSKHLCQSHARNSLKLIQPGSDHPSALEYILVLVRRSDTVAVKSEGTRVLVNVIKSLHGPAGDSISDAERKEAISRLLNARSATALSELVSRSQKYPLLLNEGIVAMTLLGSQIGGASFILGSLFSGTGTSSTATPTDETLSQGSVPTSPSVTSAGAPVLVPDSPTVAMLVTVLNNRDGKFPPELRANVCTLLSVIGRWQPGVDVGRQEALKNQTWDTLDTVANGPKEDKTVKVSLKQAAKTALEAWK